MKTLTNILIGRSGCGKGTQIEKLTQFVEDKDWNRVFHLEAGDRFRNFIKDNSYSSDLAKEIADEGGLQPEFLSIWAWGGELAKKFDKDQHLFIDGTPRRLIEAKILESVFDFYNIEKVNIIYLNVSRDWATNRMKARGRADDLEDHDIKKDWIGLIMKLYQ